MEYLAVGLGGCAGSCLRYGITRISTRWALPFPLGTLISNVFAGLIIGFVIGLDRQTGAFSPSVRLFLTTGMMGGLSTFSTFSLETVDYLRAGQLGAAALNAAANLLLCLLAVGAGMLAASHVANPR